MLEAEIESLVVREADAAAEAMRPIEKLPEPRTHGCEDKSVQRSARERRGRGARGPYRWRSSADETTAWDRGWIQCPGDDLASWSSQGRGRWALHSRGRSCHQCRRRSVATYDRTSEEMTGQRAKVTLAHGGYHTGANLEAWEWRDQPVTMPEGQRKAVKRLTSRTGSSTHRLALPATGSSSPV